MIYNHPDELPEHVTTFSIKYQNMWWDEFEEVWALICIEFLKSGAVKDKNLVRRFLAIQVEGHPNCTKADRNRWRMGVLLNSKKAEYSPYVKKFRQHSYGYPPHKPACDARVDYDLAFIITRFKVQKVNLPDVFQMMDEIQQDENVPKDNPVDYLIDRFEKSWRKKYKGVSNRKQLLKILENPLVLNGIKNRILM